jgi:glycosyltransferase involved in cell wall biosynthesis
LHRAAVSERRPDLLELARATEEMELALTRACDGTIAVSHSEREHLRSLGVRRPVFVLPNVHLDPIQPAGPDARTGLLFIGGFEHEPNIDAADHLVRDVLPRIHDRLGPVPLTIVGDGVTRRVRELASPTVSVVGWVPDLASLYARSRVAVAPLRYGAGIKGKVTGCVGVGLPTVTTSVGAEGTGLRNGVELLVGDDFDLFATHVAALYRDDELWRRVSTAGQRAVERRFGRHVTERRVRAILRAAGLHVPARS